MWLGREGGNGDQVEPHDLEGPTQIRLWSESPPIQTAGVERSYNPETLPAQSDTLTPATMPTPCLHSKAVCLCRRPPSALSKGLGPNRGVCWHSPSKEPQPLPSSLSLRVQPLAAVVRGPQEMPPQAPRQLCTAALFRGLVLPAHLPLVSASPTLAYSHRRAPTT